MTLLENAKQNKITDAIRQVARDEGLEVAYILKKIAAGEIVIPINKNRQHKKIKLCGIGRGLRTKVNANIGTSSKHTEISEELEKLNLAIEAGADTIMDLSTGGDLPGVRSQIVENSTLPVGSVPIYEAAVNAYRRNRPTWRMTEEDIFGALQNQAKEGIDFFTIHCG